MNAMDKEKEELTEEELEREIEVLTQCMRNMELPDLSNMKEEEE